MDGVVACLAGWNCCGTMNDLGIKTTPRGLWTTGPREGTPDAPAMLSSGVFAGIPQQEWALAKTMRGPDFGE